MALTSGSSGASSLSRLRHAAARTAVRAPPRPLRAAKKPALTPATPSDGFAASARVEDMSSFDGDDFDAAVQRAKQAADAGSSSRSQQQGATLFRIATEVREAAAAAEAARKLHPAGKKRSARGPGDDAWMLDVPLCVADPPAHASSDASTNNIVTSSSALRSRVVATGPAPAAALMAVGAGSTQQESGAALLVHEQRPQAGAQPVVAVGGTGSSAGQSAAASRAAWGSSHTRALRRALSLLNHSTS